MTQPQPSFTLVSHALCPYVQRAAIVLTEKGIPFVRRHVDLANKPDWFLACSPLGKTPVLLAGNEPIFESAVICEYLDEILAPRLHPESALDRARHRGWMEFGSSLLNAIAAFYNAEDDEGFATQTSRIRSHLSRIESTLEAGPWFSGERFSMVDAVFGPAFRYFDVFDRVGDFRFFEGLPKTTAWRQALAERASVREAAHPAYPSLLRDFLHRRGSALSRMMAGR